MLSECGVEAKLAEEVGNLSGELLSWPPLTPVLRPLHPL